MKKSHIKKLVGFNLALITIFYLFFMIWLLVFTRSTSALVLLFTGIMSDPSFALGKSIDSLLTLFGISGLMGVWLLFFYEELNFKNKKSLTFRLLTPGFISASLCGFIFIFVGIRFSNWLAGFEIVGSSLLLFALIVAYFTKKKLFK